MVMVIYLLKTVSAKVTKGTAAEMRATLVATLRPILDQAVIDLQDEVGGKTSIVTNVLNQVNTYLQRSKPKGRRSNKCTLLIG